MLYGQRWHWLGVLQATVFRSFLYSLDVNFSTLGSKCYGIFHVVFSSLN